MGGQKGTAARAQDLRFMRAALAEAVKASSRGEVPVGAVVVADGRVVGRGHNQPVRRHDPSAHAEIVALRRAGRKRKNYRLSGCDLYVTLEPCPMCAGAIVQARIRRLVYGASDPKAGAVRSIMRFPFKRLNHRPEITGGVIEEACGRLLRDFFRARRQAGKKPALPTPTKPRKRGGKHPEPRS
jgi:tRNA(adenine34) deaminase